MSTAWREHIHGQIEPLADCRPRDWFDYACAAVILVVVGVAVAHHFGWLSWPI